MGFASNEFGYTVLWLIIGFVGIEIGGGLYEWRCIYPLWAKDPTPRNLKQKIQQSGQELAGRRFWPFVSPTVLLLSALNIIAAYQDTLAIRPLWLFAGSISLLTKITTYAYFVPTMVLQFYRAETIPPSKLTRMVRLWVRLSPVRILAALAAWAAFVWVLLHL